MRRAGGSTHEVPPHRAGLEWSVIMNGIQKNPKPPVRPETAVRSAELSPPVDESPIKNGRRLQHAEGASHVIHLSPEREPQPRGARVRGNHRVEQVEAAERFIAAPQHEKMHDERL